MAHFPERVNPSVQPPAAAKASSDKVKKQERVVESEPDITFVKEQCFHLEQIRNTKMEKLNDALKSSLRNFISEIHNIEHLINQISQPNQKEQEKTQLIIDLNKKIEILDRDYKRYGFRNDFLKTLIRTRDFNLPIEVLFALQLTKNIVANRIFYFQEIGSFITENKKRIAKRFFSEKLSDQELESLKFSIEFLANETHHAGKSTVIVKFRKNDDANELFRIVYKPRNADIDKNVIKTFKKLNKLPENQRSFNNLLPEYKIRSYFDKSLWEYIDGDDVHDVNVGSCIASGLQLSAERKVNAQKSLNRMDAILTDMGVSDLHKENVKIKNVKNESQDIQIIPIDLENVQAGHATQLGGDPESIKLTAQEQDKIKKHFKNKIFDTPHRYIPLNTNFIAKLVNNFRAYNSLTNNLYSQIESDGFEMKINKADFEKLILKSILYNDVPYFTSYQGTIYYGLQTEGSIIAKMKERP